MAGKRERNPTEPANAKSSGLPLGVKLLGSLKGHDGQIWSLAFEPDGERLVSGGEDHAVRLWNSNSGELLHTFTGHHSEVWAVAFDPDGRTIASGGSDNIIKIWESRSGEHLHTLKGCDSRVQCLAFDPAGDTLVSGDFGGKVKFWNPRNGKFLRSPAAHRDWVWSVVFDNQGSMLASSSDDSTIKLRDSRSGKVLTTLKGYRDNLRVFCLAFDAQGHTLASGSSDSTVKLWELPRGRLLRTLEGHTKEISNVAFSPDGRLLATKSLDQTIRLWSCDTWETLAIIPVPTGSEWGSSGLAFHPSSTRLAAASGRESQTIQLWDLDFHKLFSKDARAATKRSVHHTTGKIVLVGDHSVGKSGLGHRLIHGSFEKQESTHGQQFWVFPALGQRRADGTDCEAILWDFAGQPDYRLVHALFVDNADLALVLFDASDLRDPLHGVDFWLKQLQAGESRCPIILVAAQTDRGTCSLTPEELNTFCSRHGISGFISTSALTGAGIAELIERMRSLISWEDKAATVTTATFKRIKDYVLGLKEAKGDGQIIVTPANLRERLESTDADWRFTDAEMMTAAGHLENYGYIKRLQTSKGEQRILLQPERLNNLASSFVLEARRNPKGLGALEEKRLLAGGYDFPELKGLRNDERDALLDSAALLFLEHNVCFRETDPLRKEPYLVFPELINLKKPPEDDAASEDGVAYTISGPTENVFASLVVLLGYTHTFTRTAQWHNNARYEVGDGLVCGFRQEAERDGELDVILSFGPTVGLSVRTLFQGLFESFLARRNLTVLRYEPVRCSNTACGHLLDRVVVRQRLKEGKAFTFCNDCGEKLALPAMAEPIQLTREVQTEVELQRRVAEQRTRFEQAVFRVQAYISEQKITPPETFISYAWGVAEQERWVEKRLATDLQKAGINVLLDRWHNTRVGKSVARFVERIAHCDRIVVVGTPAYRHKYENKDPDAGTIVAAEVDVIHNRLVGTESEKERVLPILLAGDKTNSLPPLLHGRVYADFRDEQTYFATAFDLVLSLYQLPPNHPAVTDLRESLHERELR